MASMRRIVMFNWLTADGYFAGSDGNLDWVVPDDEQAKSGRGGHAGLRHGPFRACDVRAFRGFWRPAVEDSPTAPDPYRPGQRSREHRAIAIWLNEATKLVFSSLFREFDPREVEAMKQRPGKDMMVFGSGSIVSQLIQHGLIDEYQFVVCPIFLGSGRPLLNRVSKRVRLDLLEAKKYPSGDVLLRYARSN